MEAFRAELCEQGGWNQDLIMQRAPVGMRSTSVQAFRPSVTPVSDPQH